MSKNSLILNSSSIFLVMFLLGGRNVIADPLQIGRYNDKHSYNCEEYPYEFLEHKE